VRVVAASKRTLYSSKTGKIALQNVGKNVSGSSFRTAHSVLAPRLCVVNDICASLRHFGIVFARSIARARAMRRGVRSRRFIFTARRKVG
jgi:hypothetical protein